MSKSIMIVPVYVIQHRGKAPEVRVLGHEPQARLHLDHSLLNPSWQLGMVFDNVDNPNQAIHENLKFAVSPRLARDNVRVPFERFENHDCHDPSEHAWKIRIELDDLKVPYLTVLKAGAYQHEGKEVDLYLVRPIHGLSLREVVGYKPCEAIYGLGTATRPGNEDLIALIKSNIEAHPDFFNYVG